MMRALRVWRQRREQRDDITVLACLMVGDEYYFDIWGRTGLGPGRVYPALARPERHGLVRSGWEIATAVRRRYYSPTEEATKIFRFVDMRDGA